MAEAGDLYDQDFLRWTEQQATELRRAAKESNLPLDWENLAEEIESLGISQQRELYSRYAVILLHLMKWQYQPGRRSRSWRASIRTQRREIAELLLISPGLKPKRRAQLARAYIGAREDSAEQTGLPIEHFPEL